MSKAAAFALVMLWMILGCVAPAGAHTAFDSSNPADGSVLTGPVAEVTIGFSGYVEPSGDGFQLLYPDGTQRAPMAALAADGTTWILNLDPAVESGTAAVRWTVTSEDGHVLSGGISFTVDAPTTTQAPVEQTTSVPAPPASTVPEGSTDTSSTTVPDATSATPSDESDAQVQRFLDSDAPAPAGSAFAGVLARLITVGSTMVAVGGLVFLATVLRDSSDDGDAVRRWIRRAIWLLIVGAASEFLVAVATRGGSWSSVFDWASISAVASSSFGVATALRVAGAVVMLIATRITTGSRLPADRDQRQSPPPSMVAAFLGAAMVVSGSMFDGHTVTKGPRVLTSVSAAVHEAAASVWVGGALMLVYVLWRSRRAERSSRVTELGLRFSGVAGVAIAVVGVAGALLALIILNDVSELWSTSFGRILLAKVYFVLVAAGAGGYNRWVLLARMKETQEPGARGELFRKVLGLEAVSLATAVVLTAVLMGAST